MTRAHPRFAALWLVLFVGGCHADPPGNLATVQIKLGDKSFTLEVADTTESRSYGLMRRDSMPADHGMIFVFGEEEPRSFWMKNTRIPLDIIFLDHTGKVVSVKQMKPQDLSGTPSDGPAMYAIELNKDAATSANVKPGMTIMIPQGLKSKD